MSMTITGIPELYSKLDGLRRSLRTRILRKSVRAANTPIRKMIKSFAPVGKTGALQRSVASRIAKIRGDKATGISGPQRRFPGEVKPTKYAHLVESGTRTKARLPKNTLALSFTLNGRRVAFGRVYQGATANRFMQRATQAAAGQAGSAFTARLTEEVHRQAAASKPSEVDDGN